MAHVSGKHTYK